MVADCDGAPCEGAGDDGTGAADGEGTVDPQAGPVTVERGRDRADHRIEHRPEAVRSVEPDTARNVDGDDRRALEEGAGDARGDLPLHPVDSGRVDPRRVSERNHPVTHSKDVEDAEVVLGLWLPPFGRRNDEHARVNGAHPRDHVLQESHVSGHVHDADLDARREERRREAEIDGEPAAPLLFQTVGMRTGEPFDERRLAVVHVTRGDDDSGRWPPQGIDLRAVRHQSRTSRRMRLFAFPFDSVFTTRMRPTSSVRRTWVPPSACLSRPTMSITRSSVTDGGTRLTLVRIRSSSARAASRWTKRTSIGRAAASSSFTRASTVAPKPSGSGSNSKSMR